VKLVLLIAISAVVAVSGVLLVGLYAAVNDSGGGVVSTVGMSLRGGDWRWVTTEVMVGAGLMSAAAVGLIGVGVVLCRRLRRVDRSKDVVGFTLETSDEKA
jgi:hypothetical protein